VQELEERRARAGRAETLRASLRAVEASSGPKRKQGSLDSFLSPTPKKSFAEEPFEKFQGERGPKHPCTLSIRAQRLLDEKKEQAEVVKALEEELKNERAKGTEAGREAARRQLEAVNSRCSTISLPDAPRKRGRPPKSEAEKVAQAEFRKLRMRKGPGIGVSQRRDMPSAEAQLVIRKKVMAKALTPEAASKRPATFWKDEAEEWGLTAKMLKCICSATQGERALAFHEAQKAKPDARGARRHWKRFDQIGQGRRLGTPRKGDTSILKTKPNRFALFWDRIKGVGKEAGSQCHGVQR